MNQKYVLISKNERPIFLNSGQFICSGDKCPQIKYFYFLVLLPKKRVKRPLNGPKMSWIGMVWFGLILLGAVLEQIVKFDRIPNIFGF